MQVKLLSVNFYLNGRLHAVSIGKPSEHVKFLDGSVFKNRTQTKFQFSARPYFIRKTICGFPVFK